MSFWKKDNWFNIGLATIATVPVGGLTYTQVDQRWPREHIVMHIDGRDAKADAESLGEIVRVIDGLGYVVKTSKKEALAVKDVDLIVEPIIEYGIPNQATVMEKPKKPWWPWPGKDNPPDDGITNPNPNDCPACKCECNCCPKDPVKPPPVDPPPPVKPPIEPPDQGSQIVDWGHKMVQAPVPGITAKDVTVCIVDTGIDKDHPDLSHVSGKDFTGKGDYEDGHNHGSHVAGIVAALNNKEGVVGASQAKIVVAKVLSDKGSGSNESIAAGVNYCNEQGADILNLSLGGPSPSRALEMTLLQASKRGAWIFVAAGNESSSRPSYPAAYRIPNLFSVSALDKDGKLARFSNFGKVEMTAPGVDMLSTVSGGKYARYSGTSMASPLAAGVAALYRSTGKAIQFEDKGDSIKFGKGMITAVGVK